VKRIALLLRIALAVALLAPPTWAAQATTVPATQPANQAARAAELRASGMHKALGGEFQAALELLSEACRLSPQDECASEAKSLLEHYLQAAAAADAQRAEEHAEAVARVRRGLLAEATLPTLPEETLKPLREKVGAALEAFSAAGEKREAAGTAAQEVIELRGRAAAIREQVAQLTGTANTTQPVEDSEASALLREAEEALERAGAQDRQAASSKVEALMKLDEAAEALKAAAALLAERNGDYADAFATVVQEANKQIAAYRGNSWWSKSPRTPMSLNRQNVELKLLDDTAAEALADVDAMVDAEPWRAALGHARMAKELAAEGDTPTEQAWYAELVRRVEDHGEKAVSEARWYDALGAYSGLKQLEEDNEQYERKLKTVRRHVRVLGLYGQEENAEDGPVERGRTTWRDLVAGADKRMVETAISQVDAFYVQKVDYRGAAEGALLSIRVLAETPQAARSFPLLADTEKKAKFLGLVGRQAEAIRTDPRVAPEKIIYALNGVLRASERTVEIPPEVIAVEFTDGLLAELDRFSSMIWPHDVTDFHKNTMGHFYGVGIQITKDPGEPLKVVTPLADSPALKAGIRPGDLIVGVDGTATKGLSLDRLVSLIMGEKGTKVVLTVERRGRPTPLKVPIIRDKVDIKTVKGWKRQRGGRWQYLVDPEDGVGYIRVAQFTENTHAELIQALNDLGDELAKGHRGELRSLILDLRFNPGGLLRSATDVANEFVSGGRIVATRGRQKRSADIRADITGSYLAGDLIVLVNEHSASAAEILSGALKDLERAGTKIVGKRTFGKGSVQNVIPIRSNRAYLKLTTAYYYLPSGRLLHRRNGQDEWGVDPNLEVLITPKQVKRWLELRRQTDLLHQDEEPVWLDEDLRKQYGEDFQLQTAVLLLRLMQLKNAQPAA